MWIDRVDRWLDWLKWPVATVAVLATPSLLWSSWKILLSVPEHPWNAGTFLFGLIAFVFMWRSYLHGTRIGKWIIRAEHEFTHLIFAVLTGHRILSFRTKEKEAQVRFRGKGNWLITSAPYFFPTSALVLFLLSLLMPIRLLPWTNVFLGIATGFHVVSGYHETHRDQDDLKQLRWPFCWCFLPAANLFFLSLLLAVALMGWSGLIELFTHGLELPKMLVETAFGSADRSSTGGGE